jgi:hypothetical protein
MPSSQATVIDEGTPERVKQAAAKKRNAVAMANLTMAFETDGVMALVYMPRLDTVSSVKKEGTRLTSVRRRTATVVMSDCRLSASNVEELIIR